VSERPGTLTFLFTDIEGSTRLARQIGELYPQVLADHHHLLRDVFTRHGGEEVDTQGDAFFVAFGRARDAVVAAVEGQRALAGHDWAHGEEIRVRMGLHTGEPQLGPGRYSGVSVHRTARICSAGHGGQILLSATTRSVVGDAPPQDLALRDLGEHKLKDFDEPERIFQVVAEGLRTDFPPLRTQRQAAGPVLVGREAELADLLPLLDQALAGNGRLALIAGEAGIGKTRLADEVAEAARQRGLLVLWGRCWDVGGAPAYWPWVQVFRSYAQDTAPEVLRAEMGGGAPDIAQMLPELREQLPDLPGMITTDSEGDRFRLFDSLVAFLRRAAKRRPLVLVLDDLHVADASSLLLLQFVAAGVGDAALLMLGTHRLEAFEHDHPWSRARAELVRMPGSRSIVLGGLSAAHVRELIEQTAGRAAPEGVVQAVASETEGNPFFVVEVVKLLAAEGALEQGADGARRLPVPEGVRAVIARRLSHLSKDCLGALSLASVIGRDFDTGVLEAVSERRHEELLDVLDEAFAAGVLEEAPGSAGRFRFAHALIRETLYDELTPPKRAGFHRRVGTALEELYATSPEPLAELAHHFYEAARAGEAAKAIAYSRAAAERAAALTAYEEAIRFYRMALELSTPATAGVESSCELLLGLGDVQARAGEAAESRTTFLEAAAAARELPSPEHLARAALGYGGRFVWEAARGDLHLVPLLEEALATLPSTDSPLRARLLARLAGGPLRDEVVRDRRNALSREAVEIARRLGEPATLGYALDGRHAAVWWPENLEERLSIATELIRVATDSGDKERALQGHHYRFIGLLERGDLAGVRAEVENQARLAEELRQPTQLFYVLTCRATLAAFAGRFQEAEQLASEAFQYGERPERAMALTYQNFQLYIIRRAQGRAGEIEQALIRSIENFPTYVVIRCVLAHAYSELGLEARARDQFDRLAAGDFSGLPRNDEWVFGMALLADVASFLEDAERATVLYRLLLPFRGRLVVSAPDACIGAVDRSLGVLAATLGSFDYAAEHFESALAINAACESPPWVAETQLAYARMLRPRDAAGDRTRAFELVAACREAAEEIGATSLVRKAAELERGLAEISTSGRHPRQ